jgi:hypothetical protein
MTNQPASNEVTKQHLSLLLKHTSEDMPTFTEHLAGFLANGDDPTGLRVSNLRMMAQSLEQKFKLIDGLLGAIEQQKGKE